MRQSLIYFFVDSSHPTTVYIPSLGGSLQPSTNTSNPTPVWIVSPTPPVSSPTLVPSIPTVSSLPPGYEPQSPPTVYPSFPVSPPYSNSPFQPQAAPIVPIVKMQSYLLTTPFIPTRPPPLVPIPASGLIPLTHTSLTPTPHTTPRNPFEEPDTTSVPTASEEQFFRSSEVPSLHPLDYPEDYTDKEADGTVVPHYGVPATTVEPVGAASGSQFSLYPIFVGQTQPPPSAIQPVQPVQKPIFRPVPLPYSPTPGQPKTISPGLTQPPLGQFPYAPTMFPDRQPTPISAATPAPSPPYPQPPPYRPFSVIPFAVTGVAGPTASSSVQSGPYHPEQPTQQQNRPPWQHQGAIPGPPLVAIHPISPLTQPGATPPVHPSPIAGQTRVPYPVNQTPGRTSRLDRFLPHTNPEVQFVEGHTIPEGRFRVVSLRLPTHQEFTDPALARRTRSRPVE